MVRYDLQSKGNRLSIIVRLSIIFFGSFKIYPWWEGFCELPDPIGLMVEDRITRGMIGDISRPAGGHVAFISSEVRLFFCSVWFKRTRFWVPSFERFRSGRQVFFPIPGFSLSTCLHGSVAFKCVRSFGHIIYVIFI